MSSKDKKKNAEAGNAGGMKAAEETRTGAEAAEVGMAETGTTGILPVSRTVEIAKLEKPDYFTREAFNNLRTNLRFSGVDIKTILITSCVPNEGKSTTAFELCCSLAEDGKKVLLVDLDLRKSILLGKYQIKTGENFRGMAHYLSGQATAEEIQYRTNVEGLSIIFAGPVPPNPTELLGSDMFGDLMKELRTRYDMIILDTPPLGTVVDAALVAPHCDGAILLIQSHSVSRRFAASVKRQLDSTGCKLLGVVLNKADTAHGGYYHYGYGGGYYKGYYKGYYQYESDSKDSEKKG